MKKFTIDEMARMEASIMKTGMVMELIKSIKKRASKLSRKQIMDLYVGATMGEIAKREIILEHLIED